MRAERAVVRRGSPYAGAGAQARVRRRGCAGAQAQRRTARELH
eukprot:gene6936-12616_t